LFRRLSTSRKGTTGGAALSLASKTHFKQTFSMRLIPLAVPLLCAVTMFGKMAIFSSAAVFTNTPNFFIRVWQVEQGLPQNKVTAVVQTRDGYIWVGTYSGLTRFDGVAFTIFDEWNTPQMPSSRVTALFESDDGALWVGFENGAVATFKNGKINDERIRACEGDKIVSISADENGDVWLLIGSGIFVRARDEEVLEPARGNASGLLSLARDAQRNIWIARNGKLSRMRHAQLRPTELEPGFTNAYVQGICAAHDGGLWVADGGRVRKWDGQKWAQNLGSAPWAMSPLTGFIETRKGFLLAGTSDHGFFVLFPGTNIPPLHLDRIGDFQADWIISLLEDREGNLWMGTGGNGLVGMRASNIQTLFPPDQWRGRAVLSVFAAHDGALWIGTEGAGLYRYMEGNWENFGFTNGIANPYVWSIAEDTTGKLFAGTWSGGLLVRDGAQFKFAEGMENIRLSVPALLPAKDGGLWAGTANGLLRWRDGRTNWFASPSKKSLRDVRTIIEATNGTVWFGTAGNGLACLEQGKIRQFHSQDGLPSDYIECLHLDDTGALWIGTFGGGLCRLKDGKFSVINSDQGLPDSVIGHIEDDGRGFFWMSSHGGIVRASKVELDACADGKLKKIDCLTYGINDGLPTIECSEGSQPAGCKTADGRLWFPTSKGLVVVDPNDVHRNPSPPPMALEGLLVDGRVVEKLSALLKIPAGGSHFEFHYTALSFVAPEQVRFKCRIEGLEKEWVDMGPRRVANYNFLPPGSYRFHVIACNNDGVWNESGVSLSFTLLPHFWQTWWFHILGGLATVLAASGIVWFDARRRMRLRLEKLEREQVVERERARIAKDIHDDLGASLTRITMLSQSAWAQAQVPEPAAKNLERIFNTARELTRAMDEIVWAVNPRHDTLDSLANYLNRFANEYLSAADIRCRLDIPLQLPILPVTAEVRHNLFLAFKEALHNVVKHACATEVRVELKLEQSRLTLLVVDNGRGFDVGQPKILPEPDRIARGNGLANMKHRLAEIGGQCEIASEPDRGTTVNFSVPLCIP
jgi:signal transduction histidine kinase/ligand-binding sensor domain-containing protein